MTAVLTATGLDIVKKAFNVLGAIDKTIPLNAELRETGFTALNFLVKSLQVTYHLWTETQGVISLQTGVTEYTLGPNGADILERPIKIVNAINTTPMLTDGFKNIISDVSIPSKILFINANNPEANAIPAIPEIIVRKIDSNRI